MLLGILENFLIGLIYYVKNSAVDIMIKGLDNVFSGTRDLVGMLYSSINFRWYSWRDIARRWQNVNSSHGYKI